MEQSILFVSTGSAGFSDWSGLYVVFPPAYTPHHLPANTQLGVLINGILTSMNSTVAAAPVLNFQPVRRVTIPVQLHPNQAYVEITFHRLQMWITQLSHIPNPIIYQSIPILNPLRLVASTIWFLFPV